MAKFIWPNTKNQVIFANMFKVEIGIKRAIKLISRQKIKRFDRFINEIRALKTLVSNLSV